MIVGKVGTESGWAIDTSMGKPCFTPVRATFRGSNKRCRLDKACTMYSYRTNIGVEEFCKTKLEAAAYQRHYLEQALSDAEAIATNIRTKIAELDALVVQPPEEG